VVVTVAFTHHHEVFGIEGQVAIGFFLDVLVGFIAHYEFAEGAARITEVQIEAVLMTVQGRDGQYVRIISEMDTWNIAVHIERKIHLTSHSALDVESMDGHFRVVDSRHRILVFISSRIDRVFVKRGLQALVPREGIHRYLAFVEADVSQHGSVGTEVEGTVETEFFFVHPVRNTVQDMIELAVLGHLRFAVAEEELHEVDVVVTYESNLVAVRREQRHLLRSTVREWFNSVVAYIEDVIHGGKRTAIDRLRFCLDENLRFIGRQDVVIETLQGAVACRLHIEDGSHFLTGLEGVFHNLFSVTADLGIMFPIVHRLDAIDAFHAVGSGGYFLDSHLLGLGKKHAQAQHHQNT